MIGNIIYKKSQDYTPFRQIYTETSSNISVPVNGIYRICAVGKGGDGYTYTDDGYDSGSYQFDMENGYCGGCGYVEVELLSSDAIAITINSNYSQVTINGNMLISATAGGNSLSGNSGTVQFGNSITIINTGTATSNANHSISIVPPEIYNNYISLGGEPGYYNTYRNPATFTQGENSGGNGIFGNDGGMGGDAFVVQSMGTFVYLTNIPGNSPSNGGGNGGKGKASNVASSTSAPRAFPGGGGGGGYGGGGGKSMGDHYGSYGREYFVYSQPGSGGDGCILIERIG